MSSQTIYKLYAIAHNFRMNRADLFFHIAKQCGLEFVFTLGNALRYPAHTHISVYTITAVRQGIVRLTRQCSTDIYPAGSVYVVAPYESHSPVYTDTFDIVSLCIDKNHFYTMGRSSLATNCLKYSNILMAQNLLCSETAQRLLTGIESIYDTNIAVDKTPVIPPKILEAWDPQIFEQKARQVQQLSRFHFIRKFKNEMGITPHQYIVQSRIRKVKKLLATGTPIVDAAAQAGFCDQSHLNRWFNRSIGITPQQYKKSCFFLNC